MNSMQLKRVCDNKGIRSYKLTPTSPSILPFAATNGHRQTGASINERTLKRSS